MTAPVNQTISTTGARDTRRRIIDRTGLRIVFLLPGGASLLIGLYAALLLLGLRVPSPAEPLADRHGILMVFGFVGTLIVLERAVAVKKWWAFASPACLGIGSIVAATPAPTAVGRALVAVGALGLIVIYYAIWRRQAMAAVAIQALGAVGLVVSALLWLVGLSLPHLVAGFTCFLVLTIVGERLELARVAILNPRAGTVVYALSAWLTLSLVAALLWPGAGFLSLALTLSALVLWLVKYDVAMRTVKTHGLTRFMAVCLLSGYVWLLVAAGIWIVAGPVDSGTGYDAALHAVFLGFTMSMIMAHAPVILPAVLRRPLPYRSVMYAPVVLLHASLALRVVVGDGRGIPSAVQIGGVLNEAALLLFVGLAVFSVVRGETTAQDRRRAVRDTMEKHGGVGRTRAKDSDAAP